MYGITGVIVLVVTVIAKPSTTQDTKPLRCYICVTDYDDSYQDPGCSISSRNVISRPCNVQHGYNRCISYRARNTRTGNVVFRRHCATREMCEYECLFPHHENCQKKCCHGDLCNVANFGRYEEKPGVSSTTTKKPVTVQNPKTSPRHDPTEGSQSTRDRIVTTKIPKIPKTTSKMPIITPKTSVVTTKTTNAPVITDKVSTTNEPLVGGPPTKSGCQDFSEECGKHAGYPGYCQYTREFMLKNCPLSCQFCVDIRRPRTEIPTIPSTTKFVTDDFKRRTTGNSGGGISGPSQGCVDTRVQCSYFANFDGYCQYHYGFMITYCRRSCGYCGNEQFPQSPMRVLSTQKPEELFAPKTTPYGPGGKDDLFPPKTTPFGPGGNDFDNMGGCIDLRENCTRYATKYEDYCNYNQDFMEIYCPFSCGYCGTTISNGGFPHPPIIHQYQASDQEFPPPPTAKDVRWLTSFCSECQNGLQKCIPNCILLLKDGNYEPTSNDVCIQLLGKPSKITPC